MTYRRATNNEPSVYKSPTSARNLLREHLRSQRFLVKDLATWWNISPPSAYRLMNEKRRILGPQYYELAIKHLRLDIHDAQELLLAAAREAGWNIKPEDMLTND